MTPAIDQKIIEIESRVAALRQRWPDVPRIRPHPSEPFDQALEELTAGIEELHILQEELTTRNDQLAASQLQATSERQRYFELFAFAPDAYLTTDLKGNITEANEASAELFGRSLGYLQGKPLRLFVYREDRVRFTALLLEAALHPNPLEREMRFTWSGHDPKPCLLRVAPGTAGPHEALGLRWMVRDQSEIKSMELAATEAAAREGAPWSATADRHRASAAAGLAESHRER